MHASVGVAAVVAWAVRQCGGSGTAVDHYLKASVAN